MHHRVNISIDSDAPLLTPDTSAESIDEHDLPTFTRIQDRPSSPAESAGATHGSDLDTPEIGFIPFQPRFPRPGALSPTYDGNYSDSEAPLTTDLSDEEDLPPSMWRERRPLSTLQEADIVDQHDVSYPPIAVRPLRSKKSERFRSFYPPSAPRLVGPMLRPKERFRHAVQKVIVMRRRMKTHMAIGVAVAEPGINPRRPAADLQFGGIRQDCVIEVSDYSGLRHKYGKMTNQEFVRFMADSKASKREKWVKVRWINIAGLSWDVMKAVSLIYEMHPLALADVFNTHSQMHSKADYHPKHLFLRILCHELTEDETRAGIHPFPTYSSTRADSPFPFTKEEMMADDVNHRRYWHSLKSKMRKQSRKQQPADVERDAAYSLSGLLFPRGLSILSVARQQRAAKLQSQKEAVRLRALKEGECINVKVSTMGSQLLLTGTVISIHPDSDLTMTQPITSRLKQLRARLRRFADPSVLVQSLLALVVDKSLDVMNEYHTLLKQFECQVLLNPQISTVRSLHILSGDLILHKSTLEPTTTLIYDLIHHDRDRCAALIDPERHRRSVVDPVTWYISHRSKTYLAGTLDHMENILRNMETYSAISENLIDYTFNRTSHSVNEVMRRLALASIVFLPLTLMTGYFGMNFDPMWSVQQNSDILCVNMLYQ
ncbi:putative magnesium -like protein [Moniliophthora roreri MCA 2997]|uniref:Magnesium-like protein n=1 Tax=Moniliophthora roreri (strain MCA 2997) TaxID=1381753 RepID=V2XIJ0_MONRO|nr:putative magnesium -like protein [Moniliophthora roreri MCA 2997]